jgi:hypothetical protein
MHLARGTCLIGLRLYYRQQLGAWHFPNSANATLCLRAKLVATEDFENSPLVKGDHKQISIGASLDVRANAEVSADE